MSPTWYIEQPEVSFHPKNKLSWNKVRGYSFKLDGYNKMTSKNRKVGL